METTIQTSGKQVKAASVKKYLKWLASQIPASADIKGQFEINPYENNCTFSMGGVILTVNMMSMQKGGIR